mmetsp:Transcript_61979/g.170296  ORF Transcript_61979/g.170296 Transcript_61979/m.170296 type:complete len:264 (+) Transcript_61979:188-979(+)|eukprot:3825490-Prymnesium_polylepis.1
MRENAAHWTAAAAGFTRLAGAAFSFDSDSAEVIADGAPGRRAPPSLASRWPVGGRLPPVPGRLPPVGGGGGAEGGPPIWRRSSHSGPTRSTTSPLLILRSKLPSGCTFTTLLYFCCSAAVPCAVGGREPCAVGGREPCEPRWLDAAADGGADIRFTPMSRSCGPPCPAAARRALSASASARSAASPTPRGLTDLTAGLPSSTASTSASFPQRRIDHERSLSLTTTLCMLSSSLEARCIPALSPRSRHSSRRSRRRTIAGSSTP